MGLYLSPSGKLLLGPGNGLLSTLVPPRRYGQTQGSTGYVFPAMIGAAALSFWIRGSGFLAGSQFLFDNRDLNLTAYWFNGGRDGVQARVNGADPGFGFQFINSGVWTKVYIEASLQQGFHLFCRYTKNEFLAAADLSDVRVYNRVWTAAEKADGGGAAPESGLLALYNFSSIEGGVLRDISGNNRHAQIVGPLPVLR
jgi:hypothetical protein